MQAAAAAQPKLTPVAKAMVAEGGYAVPPQGSGPGGRVTSKDLLRGEEPRAPCRSTRRAGPSRRHRRRLRMAEFESIPVRGVRKVIAERMLQSLQTTAQLTLQASADARALQAYRQRLKGSPAELGLQGVTINDLILFAVARTLPRFPTLERALPGR